MKQRWTIGNIRDKRGESIEWRLKTHNFLVVAQRGSGFPAGSVIEMAIDADWKSKMTPPGFEIAFRGWQWPGVEIYTLHTLMTTLYNFRCIAGSV
jgi:hypothetical protein